ncbi:hypothetical protein GGR56DRAFT_177699 [Xylariaceae sp. FL0804]|nr:hypothetical protein GGR56DRAFT_177699 [Xylariaceae sp. FL0804]
MRCEWVVIEKKRGTREHSCIWLYTRTGTTERGRHEAGKQCQALGRQEYFGRTHNGRSGACQNADASWPDEGWLKQPMGRGIHGWSRCLSLAKAKFSQMRLAYYCGCVVDSSDGRWAGEREPTGGGQWRRERRRGSDGETGWPEAYRQASGGRAPTVAKPSRVKVASREASWPKGRERLKRRLFRGVDRGAQDRQTDDSLVCRQDRTPGLTRRYR